MFCLQVLSICYLRFPAWCPAHLLVLLLALRRPPQPPRRRLPLLCLSYPFALRSQYSVFSITQPDSTSTDCGFDLFFLLFFPPPPRLDFPFLRPLSCRLRFALCVCFLLFRFAFFCFFHSFFLFLLIQVCPSSPSFALLQFFFFHFGFCVFRCSFFETSPLLIAKSLSVMLSSHYSLTLFVCSLFSSSDFPLCFGPSGRPPSFALHVALSFCFLVFRFFFFFLFLLFFLFFLFFPFSIFSSSSTFGFLRLPRPGSRHARRTLSLGPVLALSRLLGHHPHHLPHPRLLFLLVILLLPSSLLLPPPPPPPPCHPLAQQTRQLIPIQNGATPCSRASARYHSPSSAMNGESGLFVSLFSFSSLLVLFSSLSLLGVRTRKHSWTVHRQRQRRDPALSDLLATLRVRSLLQR